MKRRLGSFESLEKRDLLATFGVPWPEPSKITLSFAPDGTQVGTQPSALFQTLDSQSAGRDWQLDVLRAFQTWAVNANVNIGLAPDSGLPFGAAGAPAGDASFGDIRIAAVPLADDSVAASMPFAIAAGTWSGDVLLNSRFDFGGGAPGVESSFDLFTVMLHEAGHSLGVGGSKSPGSLMREGYGGPQRTISYADGVALRAIYGARPHDAYDLAIRNDSLRTATLLTLAKPVEDAPMASASADISRMREVDVFKFVATKEAKEMTVFVRTSGVSLLTAKATVLDSRGRAIAAAEAADPRQGDLTLQLDDLVPGQTYYVRISGAGAGADVFSRGSYRLELFRGHPSQAEMLVWRPESESEISHDHDTPARALSLAPRGYDHGGRFAYGTYGEFKGTDKLSQFFRMQAPMGAAVEVMTVMAWATTPVGPTPTIVIRDAGGNVLPSETLVNENGSFAAQLRKPTPGGQFLIEVRAAAPLANGAESQFYMAADFGRPATTFDRSVAGVLTAAEPQQFHALEVAQGHLVHWSLDVPAAAGAGATSGAGVRVTIYDSAGNVVQSLVAKAGELRTATFWLAPGVYGIRVAGGNRNGAPLAGVEYTLSGIDLSDPLGPQLTDPTLNPTGTKAPTSVSTWVAGKWQTFLTAVDAYSRPWW